MDLFEVKKVKLKNNEIMAYRESGSGDNIYIFVHGNTSSSYYFEEVMKDFQSDLKDEIHIYAIDLIGFGESSYNAKRSRQKDWARDISLFMEELKIKKASILGWSAGGSVSMEVCANYPEKIDKLILLAAVGIKGFRPIKVEDGYENLVDKIKKGIRNLRYNLRSTFNLRRAIKKKDIDFFKKNEVDIFDKYTPNDATLERYIEEILKQRCFFEMVISLIKFNMTKFRTPFKGSKRHNNIRAKTYYIHGSDDMVVPISICKESMNYIKDSILFEIEGGTHFLHLAEEEKFCKIFEKIVRDN